MGAGVGRVDKIRDSTQGKTYRGIQVLAKDFYNFPDDLKQSDRDPCFFQPGSQSQGSGGSLKNNINKNLC